jgi:DNA-binding transcriptional LysR family regulator
MDVEDLRAFVETARRGSFCLAAEALGLSQPTVSRRIRRLEDELDVELLERSRPAVTPTRQGLSLLSFAERVLAEWDRLRPSLQGSPSVRGDLHVAASTAPGECLLPPLLALFGRRYPDVRVDVHVMNSDTVEECVRARHCDVGFLGRAPRTPTLRWLQVAEEEVLLAVPADHRLAARTEVDPDDLAGEAFILREHGSGTWDAVRSALGARGLDLPPHREALRLNSPQAVLAAVAAGHGVSFVSQLALAGTDPRRVVVLRLRGLAVRRPIVLLYDARRLSRPAETFVAFVRERVPLQPPA